MPAPEPRIELCEGRHVVMTQGPVLITVFASVSRAATIQRATEALRRMRRAYPRGLGAIYVVAQEGPPPDDACRAALAEQIREAVGGTTLVLVEGGSLRASLVRGVVTGLLLLTRRNVGVQVTATLAEGLPWFRRQLFGAGLEVGTEQELAELVERAKKLACAG